MDRNNQTIQHGGGGRPVSGLEAANANEYFDQFLNATSLKHILGYYRGLIDYLHLKPAVITSFYPKLRANLTSWRAKALWKKFDARASHKCYQKGKLAAGTRVLIIGGGPCGMRAAIEAQLLGAKVVVVEKRDRFSRNNVLHLWPFVIEDLRMLGAKKFFGKFCAGAIDHISIRQLQCILMKVALLLGVEVHTEVSFEKLIEPSATQKTGWRAEFKPANHPVSLYEFDVIIGADGKRNTLQGFSRKEFRGKLAIAITANFINKKTEAEARVEEISGVAFIFNQKFFKDLLAETRIDLENIVYYKDDTHYFVMTAKKASLIEKGVIKQDLADTERLLAPENVDREALQQYAIEAANFSTNYQMPNLEFAVNHYGQPDIAMFDFTSMYAAENASKVLERNGHRLLMILVGDSLLEPFWPTGSGCARGFLSSLDAAWAIRCWSMSSYSPLEVIAERESIYRLLAQTTPDNLNKGWKSYTVDPSTRYPNLNKSVVMPHQVVCLYDTDNPNSIDRMKRISDEKSTDVPKKKKRRGNIDNELLLNWLTQQLKWEESIVISDINSVFRSGKVLCAIIHHYRPDLLDYSAIKNDEPAKNNQIAIDLLEKELGIPPLMTGADITNTDDYLTMASYLAEIYDAFRGEIPHIRLPKLDLPESVKISEVSFKTIKTSSVQPQTGGQLSRPSSRQHKRHAEVLSQKTCNVDRKTRKRRTLERVGASVDHDNKTSGQTFRGGGKDEDLAARIKSLENKWRDPVPVDKKPKDLLRAIGKIETSDWNIKEIEKKIQENKMGKPSKAFDREKVPKWSKEQFLARQTKMEKQHLDRQDSVEAKYADIDKSIKNLDQKLKEGTVRELGTNKVATITEKLTSKVPPDPKPVEKSVPRPLPVLPTQGSEMCHFCGKRVYLMERLSAEGRFFHHGCFKCQFCYTQLRLGSYAFDRDGQYGYKFFCLQHFGMVSIAPTVKVTRKPSQRVLSEQKRSPEKKLPSGISGVDLLDKVHTPERIEFSNLSVDHISSDQEDSLSQMDEDEWTDKNFGASCAELDDSDDDSSSMSDTDSDDEDAFDDALEEPVTKEGTMKWAERWKNSYSRKKRNSDSNEFSSSDQSSYYENTSDEDESDTATEGEEEIRARELRKKEVCVEPPIVHTDTGTDTEVKSSFNLNSHFPDIISNHNRLSVGDVHLHKSSSADSADFNSAESGELDLNMNKKHFSDGNVVVGKLTITKSSGDEKSSKPSEVHKANPLTKSVTSGDLLIKRNFVLPPKENRRMFGAEFVPKFQSPEPEPLLIIKRTPSKLSLPKEVGKPKVAVNTSNLDKSKYFGVVSKKPVPKKTLQRSETIAATPKTLLVKQQSLPETSEEKKDLTTFNFEPEDSDLKEIDDYIENLLANEDELHKPIDPNKYAVPVEETQGEEEEKASSSIEDLLKALETETKDSTIESEKVEEMPCEKIEDLLSWMEGLEHQTKDRKVYRSFSDVKYKNLEKVLKTPHLSECVNKIPKNNLSFFELHLSGKGVPRENSDSDEDMPPRRVDLKRSKTEITFNKGSRVRKSVNLDDIEKVDIKKMLKKFETPSEEPSPKPAPTLNIKRNSFTDFRSVRTEKDEKLAKILDKSFKAKPKPIKNTIEKFEKGSMENKDVPVEKNTALNSQKPKGKPLINKKKGIDEYSFDKLEQFVQDTLSSIGDKYEIGPSPTGDPIENKWSAQVTVSTVLSSPEVEMPKLGNNESEPARNEMSNNDIEVSNIIDDLDSKKDEEYTTSKDPIVFDNLPGNTPISEQKSSTSSISVENDVVLNCISTVNDTISTVNPTITSIPMISTADSAVMVSDMISTINPLLSIDNDTKLKVNPTESTLNPTISTVNGTVSTVNPMMLIGDNPISTVNDNISTASPMILTADSNMSTVNETISTVNPTISTVHSAISTVNPALSIVNDTISPVNVTILPGNDTISTVRSETTISDGKSQLENTICEPVLSSSSETENGHEKPLIDHSSNIEDSCPHIAQSANISPADETSLCIDSTVSDNLLGVLVDIEQGVSDIKKSSEDISSSRTDTPLNFMKAVVDSSDNPEESSESSDDTISDSGSSDSDESDSEDSQNDDLEDPVNNDTEPAKQEPVCLEQDMHAEAHSSGISSEGNITGMPDVSNSSVVFDKQSSMEKQNGGLGNTPLEFGQTQNPENSINVTQTVEKIYPKVEPIELRDFDKQDRPFEGPSPTSRVENLTESTLNENIEDLYAKVDKKSASHLHLEGEVSTNSCPPQRPLRQKSLERRASNLEKPEEQMEGDSVTPCAPIRRKRSTAASPIPIRKLTDEAPPTVKNVSPKDNKPKKEVVTSFYIPKPQTVDSRSSSSSLSSGSQGKHKNKKKDEDKDCCIQ